MRNDTPHPTAGHIGINLQSDRHRTCGVENEYAQRTYILANLSPPAPRRSFLCVQPLPLNARACFRAHICTAPSRSGTHTHHTHPEVSAARHAIHTHTHILQPVMCAERGLVSEGKKSIGVATQSRACQMCRSDVNVNKSISQCSDDCTAYTMIEGERVCVI